jgi:hypothetical protein
MKMVPFPGFQAQRSGGDLKQAAILDVYFDKRDNIGLLRCRIDKLVTRHPLPDCRQLHMAWTVGKWYAGIDDDLSVAANAFVSSEFLVDLAVLRHQAVALPRSATKAGTQREKSKIWDSTPATK